VSGKEEKSDSKSLCRGKWVLIARRKLSNLVGKYSGLDKFGEKGIARYIERRIGERMNNGIGALRLRARRSVRYDFIRISETGW
jgi:hypothetical protein